MEAIGLLIIGALVVYYVLIRPGERQQETARTPAEAVSGWGTAGIGVLLLAVLLVLGLVGIIATFESVLLPPVH